MDRGAWWATVYWGAKSQTRLSVHVHTHTITDSILLVIMLGEAH